MAANWLWRVAADVPSPGQRRLNTYDATLYGSQDGCRYSSNSQALADKAKF
jgi:hypothetical protein